MDKLIYSELNCIEANQESVVFEKGTQRIVIEAFDFSNLLPMSKVDIEIIADNQNGKFEFTGFCKDKYGILELYLEAGQSKCVIASHLDSYRDGDLDKFKKGSRFIVNVKIIG